MVTFCTFSFSAISIVSFSLAVFMMIDIFLHESPAAWAESSSTDSAIFDTNTDRIEMIDPTVRQQSIVYCNCQQTHESYDTSHTNNVTNDADSPLNTGPRANRSDAMLLCPLGLTALLDFAVKDAFVFTVDPIL